MAIPYCKFLSRFRFVQSGIHGESIHDFIEVFLPNEMTMHDVTAAINDLYRCSCRAVFILLLFRSHIDCLLSLYGSAVVIRITLSFPTARSIFKLPAVCIHKNRPVGYGENAFDRSGILFIIAVLLIVERNVIAVLGRATAACKLCNVRIAQTACLEHLSLLMLSAENIEQVLPRAAPLFADRLIAQSGIFLHELLTLFRITLDVLGELLDLAIILSDLFRIECYGNHLTFIFVISHIP